MEDSNYTRVRFIRFADDFVLGVTGSKELAKEIRQKVCTFLKNELNLELNVEKSHITHAYTKHANFLGTKIASGKLKNVTIYVNTATDSGRKIRPRRCGQRITYIKIPTERILKRLAEKGYCTTNVQILVMLQRKLSSDLIKLLSSNVLR